VLKRAPEGDDVQDSLAYLDPGSGSMLLQLLLGGVAAVGVTAKLTWRRLVKKLGIRKDEDAGDERA
jgi:hypothetical protein